MRVTLWGGVGFVLAVWLLGSWAVLHCIGARLGAGESAYEAVVSVAILWANLAAYLTVGWVWSWVFGRLLGWLRVA